MKHTEIKKSLIPQAEVKINASDLLYLYEENHTELLENIIMALGIKLLEKHDDPDNNRLFRIQEMESYVRSVRGFLVDIESPSDKHKEIPEISGNIMRYGELTVEFKFFDKTLDDETLNNQFVMNGNIDCIDVVFTLSSVGMKVEQKET